MNCQMAPNNYLSAKVPMVQYICDVLLLSRSVGVQS
jgi:hypothetical protein